MGVIKGVPRPLDDKEFIFSEIKKLKSGMAGVLDVLQRVEQLEAIVKMWEKTQPGLGRTESTPIELLPVASCSMCKVPPYSVPSPDGRGRWPIQAGDRLLYMEEGRFSIGYFNWGYRSDGTCGDEDDFPSVIRLYDGEEPPKTAAERLRFFADEMAKYGWEEKHGGGR